MAEQKAEDLKMKCYKELSMTYEALGNESQAFVYLKKYNLINDSIRSQEYTGQIAEMKTKYETEKKEHEITKLVKFVQDALYDPGLTRYVPASLPSGSCIPNNDAQSKADRGCQ